MKKMPLVIVFILLAFDLLAQNNVGGNSTGNWAVQGGVGLGTVIAVVISWSRNESILFAFLHGIFGCLYVIYFAFVREQE